MYVCVYTYTLIQFFLNPRWDQTVDLFFSNWNLVKIVWMTS